MFKTRKWYSETARRVCQTTGTTDPIEGAIALAERLTQECGLVRPAHHLEKLASWRGAKIEEVAMQDAGRLMRLFGSEFDFLIQINEAHTRAKKNFTTGHEIGHTLVADFVEGPQDRTDADTMTWNEENEEEFLCDFMAAEIVMPRREFVPRLRACGIQLESLLLLAEEFGSSLEATALGMTRAGIGDFAFVVWQLGWKKEQKEASLTLSMFEELGPPPAKYRIQKVLSCGQLTSFHFPHNKSIEMDSIIAQAGDAEGLVSGWQELNVGGGKTRNFYTESRTFPLFQSGQLQQRIFTMVHLEEPQN